MGLPASIRSVDPTRAKRRRGHLFFKFGEFHRHRPPLLRPSSGCFFKVLPTKNPSPASSDRLIGVVQQLNDEIMIKDLSWPQRSIALSVDGRLFFSSSDARGGQWTTAPLSSQAAMDGQQLGSGEIILQISHGKYPIDNAQIDSG
ncbi:hypothetical protein ACLOJK_009236 [Asimina triloba]